METSRVALITGASSGIGAAVAEELARRGWRVGLFARRREELGALAAKIEKAGGQALALPGDVLHPEDLDRAVQTTTRQWGAIDLLIANAGLGSRAKSHKRGGEAARRTIEVNLIGSVNAIDAVVEQMVERGRGQIAAVSSLAGWRGLPGSAAYSASKAGLSAYLESLRVDLAPRGITVTSVQPGFVKTPLTADNKNYMPFLVEIEDAARAIADGIEAGRSEVNFPLGLVLAMRVARSLPNVVYDAVIRRFGGIG